MKYPNPSRLSSRVLNAFAVGFAKTRLEFAVLFAAFLALPVSSPAQTAGGDGAYTVVDRGPFYRVLQKTVSITNSVTGAITQDVQGYTELGDGMNYWINGAFAESQDLVEVTPTGAEAVHGQMKAQFSGDITSIGAITLTTAGGDVFQSRPLGLFYFDSALGKVMRIAAVQSGQAILYPPNVVVYSNVLSGLNADLMLVWAKNGYEQNLVIKQRPPPPESFGFSSATTRLQLWSAMDSWPVPHREREVTLRSGLVDHILDFSDCWFPVGSAFASGALPLPEAGQPARIRLPNPSDSNAVCVAKSMVNIGGEQVLIEEVNYSDLVTALGGLQQAAMAPRTGASFELAATVSTLLARPHSGTAVKPFHVASASYSPKGMVLDYVVLSSGGYGYTFSSGTTYYIPQGFTVGPGGATFQQNTFLKYGSNANLVLNSGPVSFPASGSKVVFTSKDDNGYGDRVSGSTSETSCAANPAVWMYYPTTAATVQNALIRWAIAGINYDESSGVTVGQTLSTSSLQYCQHGLNINMVSDTLTLTNDSYCSVNVPTYVISVGRIYGSLAPDCGTPSTNSLTDVSRTNSIEGEPAIAVNPTDPQNLFLAANFLTPTNGTVVGHASSTNGGTNWGAFTPFTNSYSDPSVSFDAFGNLFVCYIDQNFSVVVLLSTNKGNSFTTSLNLLGRFDHPEMTTGPGGIWVTYYDQNSKYSLVSGAAVTGPGAVHTWSTNIVISNTGRDAGASLGYAWGDIAVGPSGQVVVVVQGAGNTAGPTQLRVSVNPSGTAQFSNFSYASNIVASQVGYLQSIPAQPDRGITPTPGLAWDRTGGSHSGRLYMVYTDRPTGNLTNTDIYVIHSDNNATNWSSPLKINTDSTTTSQFFPRIAVDQTSGKVAASWYDCRADTANNRATRLYAAVSSDGGATFSASNVQLETGQSDCSLIDDLPHLPCDPNGWFGANDYFDYTGLAFYAGYFYSAWADNSNTTGDNPDCTFGMDIYVAKAKY